MSSQSVLAVSPWQTTDQEAALKIQGLTKNFDGKTNAINEISFTMMQGEISGFLGPNGAGQPIVKVNPGSCATDISRQLLLGSTGMASLGFDFLYLGCFAVAVTVIGMIVSWRFLSG